MNLTKPFCWILVSTTIASVAASTWPQFRGPGGRGISDDTSIPTQWDNKTNLHWRTELPGPGTSSPIVVGDRVFVTCWSGYADNEFDQGQIDDLKRHLVCINATSGKILWNKTVKAVQPEDRYNGQLGQHGYATHTPVTDGERVYAFFGKTGVLGFDLDGKQLWQTSVGTESGQRGWGSASSLILHRDKVIVTASEESQAVIALDTKTGKEIWKKEAGSLERVYNTPVLVELSDGKTEIVLAVPYEVWAFDADTGDFKWYAETGISGNMNVSVQAADGIVYAFGGNMGSGAVAIRAGGKGDVTDSHMLWSGRRGPDYGSPVLHNNHLYWVTDRSIATCVNAKTGEVIFEERMEADGFPRFYASPVVANGKLYAVSRNAGTMVLSAQPRFELIGQNRFGGDPTNFNATPAISDGKIFIRSDLYFYCVGEK